MKQLALSVILILIVGLSANSQEQTDILCTQAEKALNSNNYTQARTAYLKAYQLLASSGKCEKAIECGVKACRTYYMQNLYNEAFDLCRGMDTYVMKSEQAEQKQFTNAKMQISLERMLMYMKLKRADQSGQQLTIIKKLAEQDNNARNKALITIAQAAFQYVFNSKTQGNKTLDGLNNIYKSKKEFSQIGDCYMQLIHIGQAINNTTLVANGYEHYMKWNEEQKALTANDELNVMKRQYKAAQQTISDKDDTIAGKQHFIWFLIVLVIILLGVIVFAGIIFIRLTATSKHLKNKLKEAAQTNEQKMKFIQNLSKTLCPTVNNIASLADKEKESSKQSADMSVLQQQTNGLKQFCRDMETLADLEENMDKSYETTDISTNTLCEEIAALAQPLLKPNVEFITEVPKLRINANQEEVKNILMHLIYNAAQHTTQGHIRLEFKKRGAHINQFILTDTGTGIAEELQNELFIPFKQINDMAEGDGMGLPICALKAAKMQGSLKLDSNYKKGARFILEIHG